MTNDLASPEDLAYLPGAPFSDDEVDAAVAAMRTAAGWHIAPERAETVALDVVCAEPVLRLPTRKLGSVDAVRNADTAEVVDADRYRVSHTRARVRLKGTFWPSGYEAIEVDMTHGYEECPEDLLGVLGQYILAGRRDSSVQSVSVDDASAAYFSNQAMTSTGPTYSMSAWATLRRYALPEWPGMA